MNARLKLAMLLLVATAFFLAIPNEGFAQANLADLLGLTGADQTNEQLAALAIANVNAGSANVNNQAGHTAPGGGAGGTAGHCPTPTFKHCAVPICCKPVFTCCQRFPCITGPGGVSNVTVNVTNIVINITINIFINFPDPSPAAA